MDVLDDLLRLNEDVELVLQVAFVIYDNPVADFIRVENVVFGNFGGVFEAGAFFDNYLRVFAFFLFFEFF